MDRLIFYVDVNSAFLSWEVTRRVANGELDIRLIPSAIGGDREKRTGVNLAKAISAKQYANCSDSGTQEMRYGRLPDELFVDFKSILR